MPLLTSDLLPDEIAFVRSVEAATVRELRESLIRATPSWYAKNVDGVRHLELATVWMTLLTFPAQALLQMTHDEYLAFLQINLLEASTIDEP